MEYSNKMKEYRMNKGLSMKDLSMSSGISERYLYFIENGERMPSIKTAKKLQMYYVGILSKFFLTVFRTTSSYIILID